MHATAQFIWNKIKLGMAIIYCCAFCFQTAGKSNCWIKIDRMKFHSSYTQEITINYNTKKNIANRNVLYNNRFFPTYVWTLIANEFVVAFYQIKNPFLKAVITKIVHCNIADETCCEYINALRTILRLMLIDSSNIHIVRILAILYEIWMGIEKVSKCLKMKCFATNIFYK